GRSHTLRFLLWRDRAARRLTDRHFHRRTQPGARPAAQEADRAGVRLGIRTVAGRAGCGAQEALRQEDLSGAAALASAPPGEPDFLRGICARSEARIA